MLDVIYECQRRQAWFRERLILDGAKPLDFVAKYSVNIAVETTASAIRNRLKIGPQLSTAVSSWTENLASHFAAAEEAGILIMRNGVVGNNNRRKLSVDEFRGGPEHSGHSISKAGIVRGDSMITLFGYDGFVLVVSCLLRLFYQFQTSERSSRFASTHQIFETVLARKVLVPRRNPITTCLSRKPRAISGSVLI